MLHSVGLIGLTPTPLPGGEGLRNSLLLTPFSPGRRGQGDEARKKGKNIHND